jgi:hypothetical protein
MLSDIDVGILLNGIAPAEDRPTAIGDYDDDGILWSSLAGLA